jgi:hypothetical protein
LVDKELSRVIILWQKNELALRKGRSGLPYYELKIPDMLEKYMILIDMLVKGHGKTREFIEDPSTERTLLSFVVNEDYQKTRELEWWKKQAKKWWADAIVEYYREEEQVQYKDVEKKTVTHTEAAPNDPVEDDIEDETPTQRVSKKDLDRSLLADVAKPKRTIDTDFLKAMGADPSFYEDGSNE